MQVQLLQVSSNNQTTLLEEESRGLLRWPLPLVHCTLTRGHLEFLPPQHLFPFFGDSPSFPLGKPPHLHSVPVFGGTDSSLFPSSPAPMAGMVTCSNLAQLEHSFHQAKVQGQVPKSSSDLQSWDFCGTRRKGKLLFCW